VDDDQTEPEEETPALGSAIALLTGSAPHMGAPLNAPQMTSAGSDALPSTSELPAVASDAALTQVHKRARVHEDTTLERSDEVLSCPSDDVPSDLHASAS